jgi:hypothetical protein
MSLPKLQHPIYDLNLPSTGQNVKYRPFLVKEEKVLLMAKQSGEQKDMIRAVKQIINNCVIEPKIDVDSLATFDIEYFFLKLRCVSINNISTQSYRDLEDEKVYTVDVDLNEVVVRHDPEHTNNIKVNKTVGMVMKYPSADIYNKMSTNTDEAALDVVRMCIESIYDEDRVYDVKSVSQEELDEFIGDLSVDALNSVLTFFRTAPKLFYEVKYTNSLGHERVVELNSLSDFFSLD